MRASLPYLILSLVTLGPLPAFASAGTGGGGSSSSSASNAGERRHLDLSGALARNTPPKKRRHVVPKKHRPTSAEAVAPPKAAPADPAQALVDDIQKFYEHTTELEAHFDQELISAIGSKRRASGKVWLKKPGKMRWEYDRPERKLMVADGKTLWVYEPEDEQAFRQDLATTALPSSVSFLFGTGRLTDEFDVQIDQPSSVPGAKIAAGDTLLKLVPRKPTTQYRFLYFVVDGKSHMVSQTWVYDQQGGVNHLSFSDVVTNRKLPDSKFQFTPPQGTRILRP